MPLVESGEAQLFVEEHGKGEAMLLVPGLGGSGTFWRKQVEYFSPRYRVVTYDHRGVGRSPAAPLHDSVGEMADDALALMDALGIEAAHIVGHSTGGAIGQHLALRSPKRVRSLVLSASWAGPAPLFTDLFRVRAQDTAGLRRRELPVFRKPSCDARLGFGGILSGHGGSSSPKIGCVPGTEVELGRLQGRDDP